MTRSVSFGGSVTMSMGGNIVHDLAEPAIATDAATKNYVDTHTSAGGSVTFAAPSLVFSTTNVSGAASTVIASNAQLGIFNLLGPVAQAFGDTSLTGSAAFAARQDHRHPMPATPVTSLQKTGSAAITGSVTLSEGTNITLTQSGSDISIAAASQAGSGVTQISKTGSSPITGSVTLSQGTGISLTQSGHDIAFALSAAAPGTELDYAQITSNATTTATTAAGATTCIDGNAVVYDGSTRIKVELFAPAAQGPAGNVVFCELYDGTLDLIQLGQSSAPAAGPTSLYCVGFLTPSGSASHTFHWKIWNSAAGTGTVACGAGGAGTRGPAFMRITKA